MKNYTIVAGTFGYFHEGHKALLRAAASYGDTVIVGVTSDNYAKPRKPYRLRSFKQRSHDVMKFMSSLGVDFEIHPLEGKQGNAATNGDYRRIVVSPETYSSALEINRTRTTNGLEPLEIIRVDYTLAEDLFPINSTRIASLEITRSGRRINPVQFGIATRNQLKVEALENYVKSIMKSFQVDIEDNYELETEQPFGTDTVALAAERASKSLGHRDYGVGIESGIFVERSLNRNFDFHVCAIIDRHSRLTYGYSSGFEVPMDIIELIKEGYTESTAYEKLRGKGNIGGKEGIVGVLSRNSLKRVLLIEESIRNAFIPRLSPEWYSELQ